MASALSANGNVRIVAMNELTRAAATRLSYENQSTPSLAPPSSQRTLLPSDDFWDASKVYKQAFDPFTSLTPFPGPHEPQALVPNTISRESNVFSTLVSVPGNASPLPGVAFLDPSDPTTPQAPRALQEPTSEVELGHLIALFRTSLLGAQFTKPPVLNARDMDDLMMDLAQWPLSNAPALLGGRGPQLGLLVASRVPPSLYLRKQWCSIGGQSSDDLVPNFKGYLQLLLENSAFP